MKKADLDPFFEALAAERPNPQSELNYTNPYTLLIAVVLSAQATDVGVNKATAPLFEKIQTPQAMLDLGEDGLKSYIKSINYFNNKAKNVIALSRDLVSRFKGQVPDNRKDLESLSGVGRKTANVVLNVAFGQPTLAVDTHVFRVANRTGLALGKTPQEVEEGLLKVIPVKWVHHAHHWLILHGRYTCKARKPSCSTCVVRTWCAWPDKAI